MTSIPLNMICYSGNTITKINQICARMCSAAAGDSLVAANNQSTYVPTKIDKSRLRLQHKKILDNVMPYKEPANWSHLTQKYQRKVFGRYGLESNVNPRICFNSKADSKAEDGPTRTELYEMITNLEMKRADEKQKIAKREKEISDKLEKLDQWKHELASKIAKKEAEALATKERKDRLVEDVRRHFGFKVDHRDERFKEMLEQRELAEKKKQKELKRKEKEEKLMAKIIEKSG